MTFRLSNFEKFAYRADKMIGLPEQRLLLGLATVVSHPLIELNNKNVDKDTRLYSASKAIAKTVVGTTTGVLIRIGFIELCKKLVKDDKINLRSYLPNLPETIQEQLPILNKCATALGGILAVITMLGTNFLIDAPLTQLFSKKINKDSFEEKKELNINV